MKNEKLYEKYVQDGWPCGFLSCTACDAYNAMIKMFCLMRKNGAEDLAVYQELIRAFSLLLFFGPLDIVMFNIEKIQWKRKS